MAVGEYFKVTTLDQLPPGALLEVELPDGLKVCLAHTQDNGIYAIVDRCTHRDFPMHSGSLHGGDTIECAWHGARFDLKTGRALKLPAIKAIQTFDVKVDGNDILIAEND